MALRKQGCSRKRIAKKVNKFLADQERRAKELHETLRKLNSEYLKPDDNKQLAEEELAAQTEELE